MYITRDLRENKDQEFDWGLYFAEEKSIKNDQKNQFSGILREVKINLKENGFNMTIAMNKVMKLLLENFELNTPDILELGAATGFLSKWLVNKYQGKALLIDNNPSSYEAFCEINPNAKQFLYKVEDIFMLQLDEKFDITCSFGLIEHFVDKKEVLDVHKKFLNDNGVSIIIVPLDSPLTRTFFAVHPELNLGYRELLTESEFLNLLKNNGFKVLKSATTIGYVYDFIAAVCKIS